MKKEDVGALILLLMILSFFALAWVVALHFIIKYW